MGQNLKQEKLNNSRKKKTIVKIHSYQLSLNETQYWATSDQNQTSSFHKLFFNKIPFSTYTNGSKSKTRKTQ